MKTLKYLLILGALATGLSSCVVRVHDRAYIRGHYDYYNYGRHWVPGHYAQ